MFTIIPITWKVVQLNKKSLVAIVLVFIYTVLCFRFLMYSIVFSYYNDLLSRADIIFYGCTPPLLLLLYYICAKGMYGFKLGNKDKNILVVVLTIFLIVSLTMNIFDWKEEEKWKYSHFTAGTPFYRDFDHTLLVYGMYTFSVFVEENEYLCTFGMMGVKIIGRITDYKSFVCEYEGRGYITHEFFFEIIKDKTEYESLYNKLRDIGWENEEAQEFLYSTSVIRAWENYKEYMIGDKK